MLESTRTKALPVLNRVPDLTPAAQACCGVCRTCATTNILAFGGAALASASLYVARLFKRR
jgi:hypothetical protein